MQNKSPHPSESALSYENRSIEELSSWSREELLDYISLLKEIIKKDKELMAKDQDLIAKGREFIEKTQESMEKDQELIMQKDRLIQILKDELNRRDPSFSLM